MALYEAPLHQTLCEAACAGCRVMRTRRGVELISVGIEYLLDMFSGLHWFSLSKEFRGASRRSKRRIVKGCIGKILHGQALSMLSNSEREVYPPWIKPEFIDQTEAYLENNAGDPVQRKLRSDHRQSL